MMKKITSKDGTQIICRKSGTGPPLILVHGATADLTRWSPISPRFEDQFTVYAVDRRGRGGSGDAPGYDFYREVEDITAVIESIPEEPIFVLAHSFGALLSLEAALQIDKISRLILYEPPIPPDHPPIPLDVVDRMQALIDEGKNEESLVMFFREIVKMPEHEFDRYRQLPVWRTRVSLAPTLPRELGIGRSYHFEPDRFAGLSIPTLVLLGGDSPPAVKQGMEMLNAALPNSKLVILPGQQHIAMDTDPELFASQVKNFLLE